jgi:hypothetical protein
MQYSPNQYCNSQEQNLIMHIHIQFWSSPRRLFDRRINIYVTWAY